MDTTTKTADSLNVSGIAKGDRLILAAHRAPSACRFPCSHAVCNTDIPETTYEVLSKRRAPKGERVNVRHPHGWGCAIVADAAGNLPAGWRKA